MNYDDGPKMHRLVVWYTDNDLASEYALRTSFERVYRKTTVTWSPTRAYINSESPTLGVLNMTFKRAVESISIINAKANIKF